MVDRMKINELLSGDDNSDSGNEGGEDFKKEMLEDYLEENSDKLLCVHILSKDDEVPLTNSYDIASYLEEFEDRGIIEMVRRESCAYKSYAHNTYKFVPKDERKEEKEVKNMVKETPNQKNVFKAIKSRYDEGDEFKSTKILNLWNDSDKRTKASTSLYQLAQSNLIDKVEKGRQGRTNVNTYKLKETDYSKKTTKEVEDGEEEYKCPECDFTSDNKQAVSGHMQKHKDKGEKYQCPECDFTSETKQGLAGHMQNHSDDEEEEYNCPYCDYSTTKTEKSKEHMRNEHFEHFGKSTEEEDESLEKTKQDAEEDYEGYMKEMDKMYKRKKEVLALRIALKALD